MPTYDKDGHLFGDAVFKAKYWELQNENEEMQIRYSEENGLEINGVGGGVNADLSNVAFPLEWETVSGDVDYSVYSGGTYWEGGKCFVAQKWGGSKYSLAKSKDFETWEDMSLPDGVTADVGAVASAGGLLAIANAKKVYVTLDGSSWVNILTAGANITELFASEFKGAYYVAAPAFIYKSSDGSAWADIKTAVGIGQEHIHGMAANAGVLLVASASHFFTTANGTSWSSATSGYTHINCAATDGSILVVSDSTTHDILWSANGTTWTAGVVPSGVSVSKILCDGARYMGVNDISATAILSQDGKTWETTTLPLAGVNGLSVGYAGEFYISNYNETTMHTTKTPDAYNRLMPVLNPLVNQIMANIPSGGGGGENLIVWNDQTAGEIAEAAISMIQAGISPVLVVGSEYCRLSYAILPTFLDFASMITDEDEGEAFYHERLFSYNGSTWSSSGYISTWAISMTED